MCILLFINDQLNFVRVHPYALSLVKLFFNFTINHDLSKMRLSRKRGLSFGGLLNTKKKKNYTCFSDMQVQDV